MFIQYHISKLLDPGEIEPSNQNKRFSFAQFIINVIKTLSDAVKLTISNGVKKSGWNWGQVKSFIKTRYRSVFSNGMNYKKILNQRDLIIHILIRYDKCPHLLLVEVSICGIYVSSNAFFFRPATPTWPLLWYDIISDALTLAHRHYWLDYRHLTPQRWILVQYHISKVLDPGGIEPSPLIISTFIWWLNKCKPLDLSDKYL